MKGASDKKVRRLSEPVVKKKKKKKKHQSKRGQT